MKKTVTFSSVNILVFPMIMGDTPACKDGASVELSWEPLRRYCLSLNTFENERSKSRRPSEELYLSSFDRSILVGHLPSLQALEVEESKVDEKELILESMHAPPMYENTHNYRPASQSSSIEQLELRRRRETRQAARKEFSLEHVNDQINRLMTRLEDLEEKRKYRIQATQRRRLMLAVDTEAE